MLERTAGARAVSAWSLVGRCRGLPCGERIGAMESNNATVIVAAGSMQAGKGVLC